MNNQITSKRSIVQTVVISFFATGFLGAYSVLAILRVIDDLNNGIPLNKILIFIPTILLSMLIYCTRFLIVKFPQLTIDKFGVTVSTLSKKESYRWEEIIDIELTGKQPQKLMFFTKPTEATTIRFKDNSTFVLWADHYQNISDLRIILDRANKLLKDRTKSISSIDFDIIQQSYSYDEISFSPEDEYNGNHLFTFNGILFYSFLIFVCYLISKQSMSLFTDYEVLFPIGLCVTVLCGLLSYQMHYFILTDKFLIVKNSMWFWRNNIYALDNIREVLIETPEQLSTSMTVITRDFRTKRYPASNLKGETWKLLKRKLVSNGIKVRDEA
jgi:hypothetical protein